ncbi:NAD(P)/FAD-dependent oxidoreductase [Haloferula sp.]|uniref:NAD(P)/FAD-dependent oxidoreductase n=1 Tax=Haloferula sp. TaxID=2497595 RepID=UPI0032A029F7
MKGGCDIAIVGAGPAGCTLASLLKMRGFEVLVFDDDKRPDLLVGESLLPTVVNLMRRLGIEDRVKEFSTYKPGVAFMHRGGLRLDFFFPEKALGKTPNYSYNIPRPEFDNVLRERAEELGVTFVKRRAAVEKGDGEREIRLTQECLDDTPELAGKHPKLLIDCAGRVRLFARELKIPAKRGGRNDVAYFAHFENFDAESSKDGQVVLSVLNHGWSWRIPLPERLSVGLVVNKDVAKEHGSTAEERLESLIDSEPILQGPGQGRKRVSEVMTYTNYQLISDRLHGPGWVAVGDAHGFVDPMLSPGLFMAMHMADLIDRKVFAAGAKVLDRPEQLAKGFEKVEAEMLDWHDSWANIIEYFYDGRIFSMYEAGAVMSELYGKWALPFLMEKHMSKQITRMVSGVSTRSRYGRGLVAFGAKHLLWKTETPEFYSVR